MIGSVARFILRILGRPLETQPEITIYDSQFNVTWSGPADQWAAHMVEELGPPAGTQVEFKVEGGPA